MRLCRAARGLPSAVLAAARAVIRAGVRAAARHGLPALRPIGMLPVLLLPALLQAGSAPAPDDGPAVAPRPLASAEVLPGPPGSATAPVARVELPALGLRLPLDDEGRIRLRLRFDKPEGAGPGVVLAATLAEVCGWLDVSLNGRPLHREQPPSPGAAPNCPRPRLVALPDALLRPTGNELELWLRGPPPGHALDPRRAAALSALQLGPAQLLAARLDETHAAARTAVRLALAGVGMLGAFVLLLTLANPQSRHLAWFGLAALGWAALLAPAWAPWPPLGGTTGQWLRTVLPATVTACAVHFLLSFGGRAVPRPWARLLALQCVLLPASLVLLPAAARAAATGAWWLLLGAQLATALGLYVAGCWARRRRDALTMLGLAGAGVVGGLVEHAGLPAGLPWHGGVAWIATSPWAALPALGVGLWLLRRFGHALVEAEASRGSLEGQVRRITAEIEHNVAQMAELRVQQITEQERKRIAADLHDDLGAKLLTIVHTCNNERIAGLAREALDEMRLSVRGLSGRPMRLADAMADWRAETVLRLGQTHIEVRWENPAEDTDKLLPARAFVQTTRILREAVSNIIKHSGASRCEVRCYAGEHDYGLVVEDNGRGIPADFDRGLDRGHGMTTMKHRAKQLNGQCLIESGPGLGTVIRLSLPL